MYTILEKSFFIGVIGDALLQIIVRQQGNFAGLRDYFAQHGVLESLFIAGGTMFVATWIYIMLGLPSSSIYFLFIYGGILDIIWRNANLMPSLQNTYYKALNPIQSFIWGGIPMTLLLLF